MLRRVIESTVVCVGVPRVVVLATCVLAAGALARAQSLSEGSLRPFVVGVVPVVGGGGPFGGGGAVGGVAIDARGAVELADQRDVTALRDARIAAAEGVAGDMAAPCKLRKISLRRLDALLAKHARQNAPPTPDVLHLAGLQRVEYLFAYPEAGDIVLAGPAEGWTIDDAGNVVGATSGAAVLQLVDLIAALRTTDALLAGEVISCSIDPTPEGLQRFARLLRGGGLTPSAQLLRRMERAVGPQTITLTGISPCSHFAQVLVAADWHMKRLGMGLAASPVQGLPSYLDVLDEHPGDEPKNAMPRWWIASGPDAKGAIILLNADDDDGDDVPDNWWGGDLDGDEAVDQGDDEVNGEDDVSDIGPLWLHKLGISSLPEGLTITLKVDLVPGEAPYWTSRSEHDAPEERVRIFLPDQDDGDDVVIQAGSKEIIGPSTSSEYTFAYNPGMPDHFGIFEGDGAVKFGIEGLHAGAPVLITTTVEIAGVVVSTDTVQVKVSPWIAFSHQQDVDVDGTPNDTVWVADSNSTLSDPRDNTELHTDLQAFFPNRVEISNLDDPWWQDGFEIGYVQSPYAQMPVVLALPRAQREWNSVANVFNDYARETMMIDGVGLIPNFAFTPGGWDGEDQDDGGNFEVQPDAGKPLGTIVMARGQGDGAMNADIVDFLVAQGVQDVISDLDLTWMYLGHIDEVVSFQSDVGNRARVASPEAAWALLAIATEVYGKGSEVILQDLLGGDLTVDNLLANPVFRDVNFKVGGYSDHLIEDVRNRLSLISPVSTPASAAGAPPDVLRRAGYLDAFDMIYAYGDEIEWKLLFTSATDYGIWRRKAGTTTWAQDGSGNRDEDSFAASQAVYILEDWWDSMKATAAGHEIHFTTKPSPNMIEMPVLFGAFSNPQGKSGARAFTNNVVNSIVHGDKMLVADVAGPDVGGAIGDIFDHYVREAAELIGFTTVETTEESWYTSNG